MVEIRSPRDESWRKLDFHTEVGVRQVLIVDPGTKRVHLLVNYEAAMVEQQPGPHGEVRLNDVPVRLWFDDDTLWVEVDGVTHPS